MRGQSVALDADARPVAATLAPCLIEETALAVRGAHEPQVAAADGEHRGDRVVQFVADAGRFIDEQEADGGEAADGFLLAGDADEARAVVEQKRHRVIAVAAEGQAEAGDEAPGFAEELAGLALARANDEDHGVRHEEAAVNGFERDDGGLAPLARAVEQAAGAVGGEDLGLAHFRGKAESLASEDDGIRGPAVVARSP